MLRGSYTFEPERYWIPFVELVGIVKFPTASRGEGLGTGKFDFGLESDFFWAAGKFTPFAMIGYRFLGSPPGTDLQASEDRPDLRQRLNFLEVELSSGAELQVGRGDASRLQRCRCQRPSVVVVANSAALRAMSRTTLPNISIFGLSAPPWT
jgi:hypothetical protein